MLFDKNHTSLLLVHIYIYSSTFALDCCFTKNEKKKEVKLVGNSLKNGPFGVKHQRRMIRRCKSFVVAQQYS